MAVVPHTAAEWGDIGARTLDLVCSHGDARVRLTFFGERRRADAVATVGATGTRLRLASGSGSEQWGNSTLAGRLASCRAPQAPILETQVLLPIAGTARELGGAARTDRCWRGAFERRPRQHRYERRASKHSALLPDGGVAQLLLGT
ncbi:hypothetical protein TcYC6_0001300 [Trypanosoma cruzi]|nr:hypothetical protein TcYC6_0001300 [Trypanosoma cruzi]